MAKKHNQPFFTDVEGQVDFPAMEEKHIHAWKKEKTFEESIKSRANDKQWTFVDGPPFITGLPHYGSLLSSIPKDVFPRFWTMKGYQVRRVWGWDCHGLPAENKVENKLGIKRKKDIEETVGVKRFIDECKLYVGEVSEEWEWYVDHIARWVDFKNAYKTMDTSYMETVMWVFKQMYEKDYIYKGLRVSLYCPHCSTPISNFEVAMDPENYKEITEPANVYKYKATDEKDTYFLAWSTTPWNKIATPALAVNPGLPYVRVKQGSEYYILAKSTTKMLKGPFTVEEELKGSDLVGRSFEPHYDYYQIDEGKRAFVIVGGEFVTADEGTGIVTIAAYGEDDLAVMKKENIHIVLHVDDEGKMKDEVPNWAGMYYLDTNPLVNRDLADRGLMYREDMHTHKVPTCWRCHTRLIFAPQDAWYVDVQRLKPRLLETNKDVNWYPGHFQHGRYQRSVEFAPDWCISRSRYWGSPVPVWETEDGERFVPGSIAELEELSGQKITDLHKPEIDNITIKSPKTGKIAKRVPEVLDSWIEAGSAPFAERHFPFEGTVDVSEFFPPDFIVEYTGQIRAWFYVLHVIAAALFDSHAFKNVVVTGVILGTDGRKMSKNYGNYPDPKEMLQKYGGDALRLYLLGSPVMHGEDILISEEEYRNQVRGTLLILWNVYKFFVTYANIDGWQPPKTPHTSSTHVLDRWITSRCNRMVAETTAGYEGYDTPAVVEKLRSFIVDDLSTWYIRRSRDRVGPTVSDTADKQEAYNTMWNVLVAVCKAAAPTIPFITEELYTNLTKKQSVHLAHWWPHPEELPVDEELEDQMRYGMTVASVVHAMRKEHQIKVKIPLISLSYRGPLELSPEVADVVAREVNVKTLVYTGKHDEYELVDPQIGEENQDKEAGRARELVRRIQVLRKQKGCTIDQAISAVFPSEYKTLDKQLVEYVAAQTLTTSWEWGDELTISIG